MFIMVLTNNMLSYLVVDDPLAVFLYALKSQESKRKYPRWFKMSLDFLGFNGALKDQARDFLQANSSPIKMKGSTMVRYRYRLYRINAARD